MPAGRPTKYTPSFIPQVDEYLSSCGREQTKLPKKSEYARFIGVDDTTLDEWAKKYPEFSLAIKKIEQSQQEQLMDDGLYGGKEVNSAMAIFLLKVNHGMKETSVVENVGKDGAAQEINIKITEEKYEHKSSD